MLSREAQFSNLQSSTSAANTSCKSQEHHHQPWPHIWNYSKALLSLKNAYFRYARACWLFSSDPGTLKLKPVWGEGVRKIRDSLLSISSKYALLIIGAPQKSTLSFESTIMYGSQDCKILISDGYPVLGMPCHTSAT